MSGRAPFTYGYFYGIVKIISYIFYITIFSQNNSNNSTVSRRELEHLLRDDFDRDYGVDGRMMILFFNFCEVVLFKNEI